MDQAREWSSSTLTKWAACSKTTCFVSRSTPSSLPIWPLQIWYSKTSTYSLQLNYGLQNVRLQSLRSIGIHSSMQRRRMLIVWLLERYQFGIKFMMKVVRSWTSQSNRELNLVVSQRKKARTNQLEVQVQQPVMLVLCPRIVGKTSWSTKDSQSPCLPRNIWFASSWSTKYFPQNHGKSWAKLSAPTRASAICQSMFATWTTCQTSKPW